MIDRRQFLKYSALGAGALAVNPAMANFSGANKDQPHRFIFIRKSNGNLPDQFRLPSFSEAELKKDKSKEAFEADLDKHELPVWLRGLDPYKEDMTILHGISCEMSEGGHWSYSSPLGAFKSGRNSLNSIKRATIDFELAYLNPAPFTHVELSLTGNYHTFRSGIVSGYAAPAPNQRNYCYADPVTAYNELFKTVVNPGKSNFENMKMAYLIDEEKRRLKGLKGSERLKLSDHIKSIEVTIDRNKKVSSQNHLIKKYLPTLGKEHFNGGKTASTPQKQEGMTQVLIAALQSRLTNVVLYTIDELSTPMRGLPGNENDQINVHSVGHNSAYSGVPAREIRNKIKTQHMLQVQQIVEALKATPEGNGTMFDNTTIIYMPETGAGHHGPQNEMPMVLLSGRNSKLDIAGRYIRLPFHASEGHKTLGNWYTTLLNAWGNPIKHYGDLDLAMVRKKMPQLGNIKQLMV